eukprot:6202383-Pleurochrysis_carterae.AAC.3
MLHARARVDVLRAGALCECTSDRALRTRVLPARIVQHTRLVATRIVPACASHVDRFHAHALRACVAVVHLLHPRALAI